MKKVKLIAGKYCHYGVGVVPQGETFEAPESDANILIGLKRASRAAADAVVPVKSTAAIPLTTIAVAPVVPPVTAPVAAPPQASDAPETGGSERESAHTSDDGNDETQPRQKRRYTRRDMQAEQ